MRIVLVLAAAVLAGSTVILVVRSKREPDGIAPDAFIIEAAQGPSIELRTDRADGLDAPPERDHDVRLTGASVPAEPQAPSGLTPDFASERGLTPISQIALLSYSDALAEQARLTDLMQEMGAELNALLLPNRFIVLEGEEVPPLQDKNTLVFSRSNNKSEERSFAVIYRHEAPSYFMLRDHLQAVSEHPTIAAVNADALERRAATIRSVTAK